MSNFTTALVSGSAAGFCVDIVLYPLDTIKTRIQSEQGFFKSGGFRSIYRGLGSVAVGSVPGAALFFSTYELVKSLDTGDIGPLHQATKHMFAATCGETVACLVRVPTEVVKQRAMTTHNRSSFSVLKHTLQTEGFVGLYRGYLATLLREVPFSIIQFPLWEYAKAKWSGHQGSPVSPWQSAVCGAVSGAVAASMTTPLDVAKTRIMLATAGSDLSKGHIPVAVLTVYKERGLRGLYAGVLPRTMWISLGGAIFLGVYDTVSQLLTDNVTVPR